MFAFWLNYVCNYFWHTFQFMTTVLFMLKSESLHRCRAFSSHLGHYPTRIIKHLFARNFERSNFLLFRSHMGVTPGHSAIT